MWNQRSARVAEMGAELGGRHWAGRLCSAGAPFRGSTHSLTRTLARWLAAAAAIHVPFSPSLHALRINPANGPARPVPRFPRPSPLTAHRTRSSHSLPLLEQREADNMAQPAKRPARARSPPGTLDHLLGAFSRIQPNETLDHAIRYLGTWSGTDKVSTAFHVERQQ